VSRSIRAPFVALTVLALGAAVLAPVPLRADAAAPTAADYQLTELPGIDGDANTVRSGIAVANGVAVGNTVGYRDTTRPAWVWNAGTLSDLVSPTVGGVSRVEGISTSGLVIGDGFDTDAIGSAVAKPMVWNASTPGTATVLAQPAGGGTYGFGIAVNATGQLLAGQSPVPGQTQRPYFYASASAIPQAIGTGFDTTASVGAYGLADSGTILAGATPIGGTAGYYLLPTPDATPAQSTLLDFRPVAMSPNGTVVGVAGNGAAVVRSPTGSESTGSSTYVPTAVNDAGDWVGVAPVAPFTAALVQGGVVTDLSTLLPGWTSIGPNALDADGDIVGSGTDPQGARHGFILSHAASTDLSISLAASPDRPQPGQTATITATIRNAGTATATGISASLDAAPTANRTIGAPAPASIPSLAGGASTTVTWAFTATAEAPYVLTGGLAWTDPSRGARTASGQLTVTVAAAGIVVNSAGDAAATSQATSDKVCDTDDATAGPQCTLRAAIQTADALGTGGTPPTITFDIPGGLPTITPASTLPALTVPAVLDGSTQPGGWVQLSGGGIAGDGLTVTGGGTTIRGLVVNGFSSGAGIALSGAGHDRVVGNRIGTNATGTAAVANSIGISLHAPDTIIGALAIADLVTTDATVCDGDCNVISGNASRGVSVYDLEQPTNANRSQIVGNVIGTNVTGTAAVPNGEGVRIVDVQGLPVADVIEIGGPTSRPGLAPGNLVSGNEDFGIVAGTRSGNEVAHVASIRGNLVGGDWAGTAAIGNGTGIAGTGSLDTIGGGDAGEGNVVIGNQYGIQAHETIRGNIVGVGLAGTPVRNTIGIGAENGALCDNVVSGNAIGISNATDAAALAGGNRIGTNAAGTAAIPNGVGVEGTAISERDPSCPGTQPDLISGNTRGGFVDDGTSSAVVEVSDAYIGTDITGTRAIPNGVGISVTNGDSGVSSIQLGRGRIGAAPGSCATSSCVIIAGNTGAGIVFTSRASGEVYDNQVGVQHTSIGVGAGSRVLPNGGDGLRVDGSLSPVIVQDGAPFGIASSVIANNGGIGFVVTGSNRPDQLYAVSDTTFAANAGGDVSLADGTDFFFGSDTIRDAPTGLVVAGGAAPELTGSQISGIAARPYFLPIGVEAPGAPADLTVARVGSSVQISGSRPAGTSGKYRIDVYGDAACSAGAQGAVALGSIIVTSPFSATSFATHVNGVPGGVGGIEVTATDLADSSATIAGRTGRYSACVPIATTATTAQSATDSAAAGSSVAVSGSGFLPGEPVDVSLHSDPVHLATVTADADGNVATTVVIPLTTPPGAHHIVLTGLTSGATAEIAITVTRGALASTGTEAAPAIGGAVLLLLVGLALLAVRRMRQHGGRRRAISAH
jgi:hypothetical protein